MNNNSKVLGVIPARGGSKGIPGKNLKTIGDRPLLEWSATALLGANLVDRSICSTDSLSIAECARGIGLEVPFVRPDYLATDQASVADVLVHAVTELSQEGESYEFVVVVQATTPTVTSEQVDAAVSKARALNLDTVICGHKLKYPHPSLLFKLDSQGYVNWLLPIEEVQSRRQDFEEVFVRTGHVYVSKISSLMAKKSIYGKKVGSLIVDEAVSVTIDDLEDFDKATSMLTRKSNG